MSEDNICPDCGNEPGWEDIHTDDCIRLGTQGQFGPPWLPPPWEPYKGVLWKQE